MNRIRRRFRSVGAFLLGLFVLASVEPAWGQRIAWTRRNIGPFDVFGVFGIAVDSSGSSYVLGSTFFSGHREVALNKYDSNGAPFWSRRFGGPLDDFAEAIAVDGAGTNIYVAGNTGTFPMVDAFLTKCDAGGNVVWTREFGSPNRDTISAVVVDSNGNSYVAGWTEGALPGQTSAGGQDAFVRKYDANGMVLWTRQFGGLGDDLAFAVATDTNGSIYVAGRVGGTLPGQTSSGSIDAFVRKYNASGTTLWTRQFGGPNNDEALAVAVDANGSIYVAGALTSGAADRNAFVRKYDASATELWTRQFGSPDFEVVRGIGVDNGGNVAIAGDTAGILPGQTSAGLTDLFVRTYNAAGGELWTRQFGHRFRSLPFRDIVWDAAVNSDSIHLVGVSSITGGGSEAFVTKLGLAASVPGDANGDGRVDCQDITKVRAAFGRLLNSPGWDQQADVDFDDQVDIRDLVYISRKLPPGTVCQ